MLALPLMVLLTVPSAEIARWIGNEAKFYLHKARYDAEAAKARAERKHSVVVDDWSIFFNANSFVVWDEDGRPEGVISGFRRCHDFGGHFYLICD